MISPSSSAVVGLCSLLLVAAVSGEEQSQQILSKTTEALTDALLKATSGEDFNYVTSPFAGSLILALAAEGSEAETKSQIVTAMGGELPDKDSYKRLLTSIKGYSSDGNGQNKVMLKNFLYVYKNYSVLDSFAELAREYYLTDVRTVSRPDLEVTKATSQDGSDAAADDTTTTALNEHAMLIFNGFSLEMSWPTSTWHKTSLSWNGNVVRAFGAAGNFAIGHVLDCIAFQLPYKNTNYALLVLLPKNKDSSSLDGLLEKLPENSILELTKNLSMRPGFVTMPCFQSSNITYMKAVLHQRTPVKTVFTDAADLSKLSEHQLFLDDMVQQTGVRVCVDGASSYALTSSAFSSQRVIKESVVADRPFVYVLYGVNDGVVYVAGKLERPVWVEEETTDSGNVETGDNNGGDGDSGLDVETDLV